MPLLAIEWIFFISTKKNWNLSIEWLFSGVISSNKTKNKTHQCNGNFSSFSHLFLSLLFFFFVSIVFCHVIALSLYKRREGVARVDFPVFFPFFFTVFKAKQWIEVMAFAVIRQPQNAENAFTISNSIIMWMIMDFFKTIELEKPQNGKKGLMTSPIYFWKCVEIKPFPTSSLDMPKSKSDNIYCSFIQILWSLFPSLSGGFFLPFSFMRRKSGGLWVIIFKLIKKKENWHEKFLE